MKSISFKDIIFTLLNFLPLIIMGISPSLAIILSTALFGWGVYQINIIKLVFGENAKQILNEKVQEKNKENIEKKDLIDESIEDIKKKELITDFYIKKLNFWTALSTSLIMVGVNLLIDGFFNVFDLMSQQIGYSSTLFTISLSIIKNINWNLEYW